MVKTKQNWAWLLLNMYFTYIDIFILWNFWIYAKNNLVPSMWGTVSGIVCILSTTWNALLLRSHSKLIVNMFSCWNFYYWPLKLCRFRFVHHVQHLYTEDGNITYSNYLISNLIFLCELTFQQFRRWNVPLVEVFTDYLSTHEREDAQDRLAALQVCPG